MYWLGSFDFLFTWADKLIFFKEWEKAIVKKLFYSVNSADTESKGRTI